MLKTLEGVGRPLRHHDIASVEVLREDAFGQLGGGQVFVDD